MAYIFATFITTLFLFIAVELLAKVLPKSCRPQLILRTLLFLFIGSGLVNDFGWLKKAPPETVSTLMEQVRGDQLYWNYSGKVANNWERHTHRHYEKSCREYAIKRLGELGPAASDAVPELIELFSEQEDYDSGDGIYEFRSQIAKSLGAIGQPAAIEPLMEMLLKKSLSPEEENYTRISWHNKDYQKFRGYMNRGIGPQAIMMGLMQMPNEYHGEIYEKLKTVRAEIELSEFFNGWSKFEIDRGIYFLEADEESKSTFLKRSSIQNMWSLDKTEFENLMDPNYKRPPIRALAREKKNGKWIEYVKYYERD